MKTKQKPPGLNGYKQYKLESLILEDSKLKDWFIDICYGKSPTVKIAEELLAIMEGRGLIRKTDFGWSLGADGRQFARNLGLIPGPSKFEINPSLVKSIKGKKTDQSKTNNLANRIEKIWKKFLKERSEELRNKLMEYYLPLVKYIAERIYVKLPDKVDIDDLISAGIFGLMDSIDAYDLKSSIKFADFCTPRIRGAILDELRSMDWVPRLVRARAHQIGNATRNLEAHLGRVPTEQEISKELEMNMEEFHRLQRDANAVGLVSLSNNLDFDSDICEIDIIEDEISEDPITEAQKRDLQNLLAKGLSRAERLILVLYYYEEMTMKEIGSTLDLSESRVSQMHSSIIARLKATMTNRKTELEIS